MRQALSWLVAAVFLIAAVFFFRWVGAVYAPETHTETPGVTPTAAPSATKPVGPAVESAKNETAIGGDQAPEAQSKQADQPTAAPETKPETKTAPRPDAARVVPSPEAPPAARSDEPSDAPPVTPTETPEATRVPVQAETGPPAAE